MMNDHNPRDHAKKPRLTPSLLSLFICVLLQSELRTSVFLMVDPSTPQLRALGMLSNPSHVSRRTSGIIPMRVFLVQTAKGLLSSSGGYKANICLLRHLASRGHSVRQLCYSHRGEVEEYIHTITESGGCALRLSTILLHLDAETGTSGTDVRVEELVMDDGVQVVSLETEAFDAAFGGKENIHSALAKETADYIEVIQTSTALYLQHDLNPAYLIRVLSRLESRRCGYADLSRYCKRKSNVSYLRTLFPMMAFLCKPHLLCRCPTSKRAALGLYILQSSCHSDLSLAECPAK